MLPSDDEPRRRMDICRQIAFTALLLSLSSGACAKPHVAEQPERAPSQLCVVRHAEAFKNLEPPPEGLASADLDSLTPTGETQARALRRRIPRGVTILRASPTNRTAETARLLGLDVPAEVDEDLEPLAGDLSWGERALAAERGEDLGPVGGESLVDGQARARRLLERVRARLAPGDHAVVVTHGDLAAILIGELHKTPLLERPARHAIGTGEIASVPIGA
jgi:broad specificity phosphatase PhoE